MSLTQVELAQFRSWPRLRLALDARPVALHGPNGSGKTNVLEALSMLAPGRGLRGAAAADQGRLDAAAGWRLRARLATPESGHEVETGAPHGGNRSVTIDDKSAPQTALARILRVVWLTPAMDRLWTDAPEGRRRFLDRLTLSLFPDHAEHAQGYERAMRQRNRLLRDQISDPAWYRALERQMAEAGAALAANRAHALAQITSHQSDRGGFPRAHLSVLPGEGFGDDSDAQAILARLSDGRRRDLAAGRSLTGPHRADLGAVWGANDTPAAISSTGEQKALLLSVILANARALADQPVLLLLDEVAAHLDATRRAALYDIISGLPAQSLLTGTGAELFADFPAARVIEVQREGTRSALLDADAAPA